MDTERETTWQRTRQRYQLIGLVDRVADDELEDAIALLEWLTDPDRRHLVDHLAGWSKLARVESVVVDD